jgi:hypothetical protein
LHDIIQANNEGHAWKPNTVSFATQEARAKSLLRSFSDLRLLGYKIQNPRCLGGRHVKALVRDWTAPQPRSREHTLGPAMIQTELSHLRTFAEWIGKPGLVLSAESYVHDPVLVRRESPAQADKDWEARGIAPESLIEAITAHDPWVGAQLRLARAFGLRVKEAITLQPHLAEKPSDSDASERLLEVGRGPEAGRYRLIPIDTDAKRAAVEAAKALVLHPSGHLGRPRSSIRQNLDRLRYVMKRFGATLRGLGVTARQGDVPDRCEALVGALPRVRGDGVGPDADRPAPIGVAEEFGDCQAQITGADLGARGSEPNGAEG